MQNISFFIPAYNCESTIAEAVTSIFEGNFEEGDEVIIVNDGSSDATAEVLQELHKQYPTIRLLAHKRNKGGGAARNTAIEHANHDLLFCLDADNVLEKNTIAPLKKYLLEQNADVASFQLIRYFSKTKTETESVWTLPAGIFTLEVGLSNSLNPASGGNYLFTKKSWLATGGYPEFAGALDTWGFGMKQLFTGAKMVVLESSFYYHRLLGNSYYLRDAWSRRKSVSLRATQILIPYFDMIRDEDIDYIMSKKHRYSWVDKIDKRPIRLAYKEKKDAIFTINNEPQPISVLKRGLNFIKRKLR